jgi:hypothetical protein
MIYHDSGIAKGKFAPRHSASTIKIFDGLIKESAGRDHVISPCPRFSTQEKRPGRSKTSRRKEQIEESG